MKYLRVELKKSKPVILLLLTFIVAFVQSLWLFGTLHNLSEIDLQSGWMNLLSDLPLLNILFLPLYITVIASILADIEHKGETFRLLFTLESRVKFYHAKLIVGGIILFLFSVLQFFLLLSVSFICRFTEPVPWSLFLLYEAICFLISFVGFTLQFALSLFFRNQVVPLAIGLISALFCTFLLFFDAPLLTHLTLWSNYFSMALSRMNYDEITEAVTFTQEAFSPFGLIVILCIGTVSYFFGRRTTMRVL